MNKRISILVIVLPNCFFFFSQNFFDRCDFLLHLAHKFICFLTHRKFFVQILVEWHFFSMPVDFLYRMISIIQLNWFVCNSNDTCQLNWIDLPFPHIFRRVSHTQSRFHQLTKFYFRWRFSNRPNKVTVSQKSYIPRVNSSFFHKQVENKQRKFKNSNQYNKAESMIGLLVFNWHFEFWF